MSRRTRRVVVIGGHRNTRSCAHVMARKGANGSAVKQMTAGNNGNTGK